MVSFLGRAVPSFGLSGRPGLATEATKTRILALLLPKAEQRTSREPCPERSSRRPPRHVTDGQHHLAETIVGDMSTT